MVSTTTAPKKIAPTPGRTLANASRFTSATRMPTRKMSTIDHAPTTSVTRYSSVRSRRRHCEPVRTVSSSSTSTAILLSGTTKLAKNTSSASGHMPDSIRCSTPLRMVFGSPRPNWITVITGYTFAGISSSAAEPSSAQVRTMLSGRRRPCTALPQRGQCALPPGGAAATSSSQVWQLVRPSAAAVAAGAGPAPAGSGPMRGQIAPWSRFACAAADISSRPAKATRPVPGTTSARSSSLTIDTSKPSMNTPTRLQGVSSRTMR